MHSRRGFFKPRAVAVLFAAVSILLGGALASAAHASAGGSALKVSTKTVERFIRRRAEVVGFGQQPMFPGARIYKTTGFSTCSAIRSSRRWVCAWSASVYEESTRDPEEYQVRQSTLRFCDAAKNEDGYEVVEVKRALHSRALRIASPWTVKCDLTQSSIDSWNVFAYTDDQRWQPSRSEPISIPEVDIAAPEVRSESLSAAPDGEPAGPPPGPLTIGDTSGGAARAVAHAASTTGGTATSSAAARSSAARHGSASFRTSGTGSSTATGVRRPRPRCPERGSASSPKRS